MLIKMSQTWAFPGVPIAPHASNAGGVVQIPGWGTRMPCSVLPQNSHTRGSIVCDLFIHISKSEKRELSCLRVCAQMVKLQRSKDRIIFKVRVVLVLASEKEMETHSSVLAWRILGTAEPGGLRSMGSHRVRHDHSDLAAAAAAVVLSQGRRVWKLRCFWAQVSFCDYAPICFLINNSPFCSVHISEYTLHFITENGAMCMCYACRKEKKEFQQQFTLRRESM